MPTAKPQTLGELKQTTSSLPDVRTEMRRNLIRKLENKERLFPELIGYDDTVLPALINAILCGHNIILLGERGQGKRVLGLPVGGERLLQQHDRCLPQRSCPARCVLDGAGAQGRGSRLEEDRQGCCH